MKTYEIQLVLDNLQYLDRNTWEQCRINSYVFAQTQTKKKINPKDILKFAWDNEGTSTEISNEDIERLQKKSEQINKIIKERNGK